MLVTGSLSAEVYEIEMDYLPHYYAEEGFFVNSSSCLCGVAIYVAFPR